MKLKEAFRSPETLLLLSILPGPLIVWKKTIDIQLHDTYFVFGGRSWGLVFLMVILTWNLQVTLRRRKLISDPWRWIQVSVTMICWLAILIMVSEPYGNWFPLERRIYYSYSLLGWVDSGWGILTRLAALVVFVLSQLIFWVVAAIRIISGRVAPSSE